MPAKTEFAGGLAAAQASRAQLAKRALWTIEDGNTTSPATLESPELMAYNFQPVVLSAGLGLAALGIGTNEGSEGLIQIHLRGGRPSPFQNLGACLQPNGSPSPTQQDPTEVGC